jgi:hypothetical protein
VSPEQSGFPLRSLADILGRSQPAPLGLGDIAKAATDPSSPSLLSILASLGGPPAPPAIVQRWFRGETIYIDGYTFDGCRFDNCQLVTSMGNFSFRDCFIDPTSRVLFSEHALKVAKLLMHDLAMKRRLAPQHDEAGIFPLVRDDGTFTLE